MQQKELTAAFDILLDSIEAAYEPTRSMHLHNLFALFDANKWYLEKYTDLAGMLIDKLDSLSGNPLYAFVCEYNHLRVYAPKFYPTNHKSMYTMNNSCMIAKQGAKTEYELITELKHPNIVNVYNYWHGYIIMERATCSMSRLFYGPPITSSAKIYKQVLAAIDHIHGHSLVHGDIRPRHLLLFPTGIVKLCDFNHIGMIGDKRPDAPCSDAQLLIGSSAPCNDLYIAPDTSKTMEQAQDIWSLGILWHDLMFQICSEGEAQEDLPFVHERMSLGSQKKITACMLDLDPTRRPTIDTLLDSWNMLYD